MRILTRYVLREFLIPLFYCMSGFISIYVLFELFGSFSRIAESDISFSAMVQYFCGYLAPYFHYLAPAALMLATLYTMWNFCRHSEITAMRASGVSFIAIVKPVLAVAVFVAVFVAWVNESYVPAKAQWAAQMRTDRFDMEKASKADNLVYRNAAAGRIWNVDNVLDGDGRKLRNVRLTFDREGGVRLMSVFSERVDYIDGEWWFTRPQIQHFDVRGQEIATPVPELDALTLRVFPGLDEKPEDFLAQNRPWKFTSTAGRFRYLEEHRELDKYRRRDYTYDAWSLMMSPFACIVITLFAIPAGIASGRQSVFKGILGALGLFFAFYALDIGCMVLAKNGLLWPVPASILPSVVFLLLGIRAFIKQR